MSARRMLVVTVWVLVAAGATKAGGAQEGAPAKAFKPQDAVVRFVKWEQDAVLGKPVILVTVTPPKGGDARKFMLTKKKPKLDDFQANKGDVVFIKSLQEGELVKVSAGVWKQTPVIVSVEPYEKNPGEEDPNAYAFAGADYEELGGQKFLVLKLKKYGETTTVHVPNTERHRKQASPDPNIELKLFQIKEGDMVEVDVDVIRGKPFLEDIWPYVPPIKGTFLKATETEPSEDIRRMTITVRTDDGEEKELPIRTRERAGKVYPSASLARAARALDKGDYIAVKTRELATGPAVVDIRKLPKPKDLDTESGKDGADDEKPKDDKLDPFDLIKDEDDD